MYYLIKEGIEGLEVTPFEDKYEAMEYAHTHEGCVAVTKDVSTHEYRCTRSAIYSDPNCVGREDRTKRQGHYVIASSEKKAIKIMRRDFPDEEHFTVDLWKKFVLGY